MFSCEYCQFFKAPILKNFCKRAILEDALCPPPFPNSNLASEQTIKLIVLQQSTMTSSYRHTENTASHIVKIEKWKLLCKPKTMIDKTYQYCN